MATTCPEDDLGASQAQREAEPDGDCSEEEQPAAATESPLSNDEDALQKVISAQRGEAGSPLI